MGLIKRNADGSWAMFRNKKGALELSITGIVVLIIAITVLGLVIFFIKKTFGETTKIVAGRIEEIKTQLLDDILATGELLKLNIAEIEVKRGKADEFVMAVQNTQNSASLSGDICFYVTFMCQKAFSHSSINTCSFEPDGLQPLAVGGLDPGFDLEFPEFIDPVSNEQSWFSGILGGGEFDIPEQEAIAAPVTIQVKGGVRDTYRVKVFVYRDALNQDCSESSQQFLLHDSKTFDVKLTS